MTQNLSKYRELRDESLWTPEVIYEVQPPNQLVRDGYDYGEGTDGYNDGERESSLIDGVLDFFGEVFGGIGAILGGAIEAGIGFLGSIVEGVANLVGGIANAIQGLFGGTTEEWEADPHHLFMPITISMEKAILPILQDVEDGIERAGQLNQDIINLDAKYTAALGEQGEIAQKLRQLDTKIENTVGEAGSVYQAIENVNQEMQETLGPNGLDVETQLDAFRRLQLIFNDGQTGFNAKMLEFSQLQEAFNTKVQEWQTTQTSLQELDNQFRISQTKFNGEIKNITDELKKAQLKAVETSFRTITPYMNGGEDDYIRIVPGSNVVEAKGNWVGNIIIHFAERSVTSETNKVVGDSQHSHTVTVVAGGSLSDTVPGQSSTRFYGNYQKTVAAVNYLPSPGTQESKYYARESFDATQGWYVACDHPIAAVGDHILNGMVIWQNADRGTWYDIQLGVLTGSTWDIKWSFRSNELGPLTSFGNGREQINYLTSFDVTESQLAGGGKVQLRVKSTGGDSRKRWVAKADMSATYIMPEVEA